MPTRSRHPSRRSSARCARVAAAWARSPSNPSRKRPAKSRSSITSRPLSNGSICGWSNEDGRAGMEPRRGRLDRKSVVTGKSVSVRVDLGGSRIIKKKKQRRKDENEKRNQKKQKK